MYRLAGENQWEEFLRMVKPKLSIHEKRAFEKYMLQRGYARSDHAEVLEWLFYEWMWGI